MLQKQNKRFIITLVCIVVISTLCFFVYTFLKGFAESQVRISWISLTGHPGVTESDDYLVNLAHLIHGPKKGNLVIENLEIEGYHDMELIETNFYRGEASDIPSFGSIPEKVRSKLSIIEGSVITKNFNNENDYIITTFKIIGDYPKGISKKRLVFKWYFIKCENISIREFE